jgi:excisionase family DNA binding protein
MAEPRKPHPIAPAPPRWARRHQVADYLHVSSRTIDHWVARGLIIAYRMPGDRALVFDLNEVDALIRSRPVAV